VIILGDRLGVDPEYELRRKETIKPNEMKKP